jgi:hypothetical protein
MATFSWAVNRLRVFLDMGGPPLEIVACSSGPLFPFRLKQNTRRDDDEDRAAPRTWFQTPLAVINLAEPGRSSRPASRCQLDGRTIPL